MEIVVIPVSFIAAPLSGGYHSELQRWEMDKKALFRPSLLMKKGTVKMDSVSGKMFFSASLQELLFMSSIIDSISSP